MDELERQVITPTTEDTLKRVGSMQVVTDASAFGCTPVQSTVSTVDAYKKESRLMATMGEEPEDVNGLGYTYNNPSGTEV